VNTIIDDDGDPWPLEFTMRFGYPTINIQMSLLEGDSGQWLMDLVEGRRGSKPFTLDKIAVGVVMALPQFPYGKTPVEDMTGVPVYGLANKTRQVEGKSVVRPQPHVHPCGMMWSSSPMDVSGKVETTPCLTTAGDYVLVATGQGSTIRSARSKALGVLDGLQAPASPFWRPDIGQRLKDQLPKIQSHGYADRMLF
jgi:phosphoribosylamine--glycine ligase